MLVSWTSVAKLTTGNVGHRIPLARKFVSELHCNVFMLSYRGYGLSEGTPSEAGIKVDAATAMEYISTHPILSKTKLVVGSNAPLNPLHVFSLTRSYTASRLAARLSSTQPLRSPRWSLA